MIDLAEKLSGCTAGVGGLGGLGSVVCEKLIRAGLGRLIIADFDVVEEKNLYRQCYFKDQVGMSKVKASFENLKRINPDVEISGYEVKVDSGNIIEIFGQAQVVAECFDSAQEKQMFVENLLIRDNNIKVVAASGLAGYGKSNAIQTRKFSSRLTLVGDFVSGIDTEQVLSAARVGIAACHQANAMIEILINGAMEK